MLLPTMRLQSELFLGKKKTAKKLHSWWDVFFRGWKVSAASNENESTAVSSVTSCDQSKGRQTDWGYGEQPRHAIKNCVFV